MRTPILMASIVFVTLLISSKNVEAGAVNENPLSAGLDWLVRHQEADGHWDSRKWSAAKKTDTATTSLALLALLEYGNSEKVGESKDNVKRCVAWLKSKQDASGRVFDTTDAAGLTEEAHGAALATLAIAEAVGMANRPETKIAAQKATDRLTQIFPFKNTTKADGQIEYGIDPAADTPTIGWCVMALKSAKVAGLKVPHDAFDALIVYLDSVEHKLAKTPDDDVAPSEYWFRKLEQAGDGHPSYRVSAIGCLCRQSLGWKSEDLRSSVARFVTQSGVAVWNKDEENVDLYYWYIATLCTFQQGGGGYFRLNVQEKDLGIWPAWNDAKNKALTENQCKDGDDAGSWNAHGYASREWGRAGQTALGCLCMEIYGR